MSAAKPQENGPGYIILRDVRVSYVNIMRPRADQNGKDKYSLTVLVPKSNAAMVAAIKAKIQAVKSDPKQAAKIAKGKGPIKNPLLDGDAKIDGFEEGKQEYQYPGDENRGHYLLRCSTLASQRKPDVLGKDKQPVTDFAEIYSGMWATVSINFYGYGSAENRGISPGLGNVLKRRDDTPFAGGRRGVDEFADEEAIEEDDPLMA